MAATEEKDRRTKPNYIRDRQKLLNSRSKMEGRATTVVPPALGFRGMTNAFAL